MNPANSELPVQGFRGVAIFARSRPWCSLIAGVIFEFLVAAVFCAHFGGCVGLLWLVCFWEGLGASGGPFVFNTAAVAPCFVTSSQFVAALSTAVAISS
jgi:hypothetical protein